MTWQIIRGDCVESMEAMDECSVDAVVCDDLEAGTAGEHLVCADLLLVGCRAFRTDQVCAYDVAVETPGRVVRIQVKTTRQPRSIPQRKQHIAGYIWQVRRSGKAGRRTYADDAFDLAALVALDTHEIAYVALSECGSTFHIRPTNAPGYQHDDCCAGCGCDMADRTKGCASCRSRHWRREQRGAPQGKRFADYRFDRALRVLVEGGDA